nr:MAG TPA: Putative head tail adaptor [Caudoviricetes sp.]
MAMINIDIGTLDKRVGIFKYKDHVDEHGLTHQAIKKFSDAWARIEPTRGNELRQQTKETITDMVKVVIRYRPGITSDMFVRYGGITYNIKYVVDPYMAHVKLELMCTVRTIGDDRHGYK